MYAGSVDRRNENAYMMIVIEAGSVILRTMSEEALGDGGLGVRLSPSEAVHVSIGPGGLGSTAAPDPDLTVFQNCKGHTHP